MAIDSSLSGQDLYKAILSGYQNNASLTTEQNSANALFQGLSGKTFSEAQLRELMQGGFGAQVPTSYYDFNANTDIPTVRGWEANDTATPTSLSSWLGDFGNNNGTYGNYTYDITKNDDGTYLLGDAKFNQSQKGGGGIFDWFGDNLSWIGPLVMAAAAPYASPALYEAGLGMGAGDAGLMTSLGSAMNVGGTAAGAANGPLSEVTTTQQQPGWQGEGDTNLHGVQQNVGNVNTSGLPDPTGATVGPATQVAGTAATAAGIGSAMNNNKGLLDTISNALGLNSGDISKLASLLSGAAASYQNNNTANRLLDMFDRYRNDADYYGNMLKQTYTDPLSYLKGPEYQSIQNVAGDYLQRKDAAGGSLANNFGRQAKLQDLAMSNLSNYRSGLASTYQGMAGISTGQGAQGATAMSGTANSPLYQSLNSLFSTGT